MRSALPGGPFITHCRLDIDVVKNQPNILKLEKLPQSSPPTQGTEVSVMIEGEWNSGRGVCAAAVRQGSVDLGPNNATAPVLIVRASQASTRPTLCTTSDISR